MKRTLRRRMTADEEVVHEREVVRREDHRALGRARSRRRSQRARKNDPRVERGDDAHHLVDPVGLARARALVEAVEVLRRARVLVDLLLHRCAIALTPVLLRARPRRASARARERQPVEQRRRARPRPCAARSARASRHIAAHWSQRPAVRRRRRRGSAAPSAVVSATSRHDHRHAEHVGLELHQPARSTVAPPSARSSLERLAGSAPPSRARRRPSGRPSPRARRARGARAPLPRVSPTIVPRA